MFTNLPLILLLLTLTTGAFWLVERYLTVAGARVSQRVAVRTPVPAWIATTAGLFPVIAAVFIFRSFLFEPFTIPSLSMSPRLQVGDFILVNKFAYGIRLPVLNQKIMSVGTPQHGDVMVFRHPNNESEDLIKRVIGLPGDRIVYRDKRLSINGQPLAYAAMPDFPAKDHGGRSTQVQETLDGKTHNILLMDERPAYVQGPVDFAGRDACRYDEHGFSCTVPAGQYFMMGDNRDNSSDSRYWGFVTDRNIVGKAMFVWMNIHQLDQIGAIR